MGAKIVSIPRSSSNIFANDDTLKIIFMISLCVFCGTLLRIFVRAPRLTAH